MKKHLIKKLDLIWATRVKEKSNFSCDFCISEGEDTRYKRVNACHIIGRRHRSTRWGAWITVDNVSVYDLGGWCGCFDHHNQYDEHGPLEKKIIKKVIGEKRLARLRKIAKTSIAKHQDFYKIKEWIISA